MRPESVVGEAAEGGGFFEMIPHGMVEGTWFRWPPSTAILQIVRHIQRAFARIRWSTPRRSHDERRERGI